MADARNHMKVDVPDIGDYSDVPVIEVLVANGESVEKDQALIVLESEKSTLEVPAPSAGIVRNLKLKVDDKVSQGDAICELESAGEKTESTEAAEGAQTQTPSSVPAQEAAAVSPDSEPDAEPASNDDAAAQAAGIEVITVPDIGDFDSVPVIELLVAVGDQVQAEQALLVLESEKSTLEVPSPKAGKVIGLKVKLDDKVSKGDALLELEVTTGGKKSAAKAAPTKKESPVSNPAEAPFRKEKEALKSSAQALGAQKSLESPSKSPDSSAHAGPATRKFARELGVDLIGVKGSGPKNRILIEDVQKHVKQRMQSSVVTQKESGIPPIPAQDFSRYGQIEEVPLSRIRKLSAKHLQRSWLNVPHVTQNDEVDVTELEAFRKKANQEGDVKLTLLPFIIKAVAAALKKYPEFGSSLSSDGERLIMKHYCHIGFAADTPEGLVVPVVKDVWSKGIEKLAKDCADLAAKARDAKLKPDEMRGGCFSISSLGGIGGSHFTPIVNAPEVAILGVSRGVMKPVWDGSQFQPRLMVPLSLSYDHRVIDGAAAARFIVYLVELLGDIRRLSL